MKIYEGNVLRLINFLSKQLLIALGIWIVMVFNDYFREGFPSARFVLCKGYGKEGFKFYTNYGSKKAKDIEGNPNVAATFYWDILNRSVRIEGTVEKLSEAENLKYFRTRAVANQIAACTSYQSTPIVSKDILCQRQKVLEQEYLIPGKEVPKPSNW